ncbi:hypothetical protein AB1Y20_019678 [Prymnesium parvum]|uniref:Heterokaryon incompatibility domain-containing protein n=1 Tax=Prymnesium parvum TaxID=97485 RepID=A0AB34JV61_PRYPA
MSSFATTFESMTNGLRAGTTPEWEDLQSQSKVTKAKRGVEWLATIDGPDMWLIESNTIMELGYIPRHDECLANGYIYSLEDAAAKWAGDGENGPLDEINFLSHNWCMGPDKSKIDNDNFDKAKMVAHWHKWRNGAYKRSRGKDTPVLWWIDWSCIDQSNSAPGAAMLPAYVKLCGMMLCCVHDREGKYFTRGWCRTERCLFTAMNSPRNWFFYFYDVGEFNPWQTIDDPRTGNITKESDRPFIAKLTEIALEFWEKNARSGFDKTNNYKEGVWAKVITPQLNFGKTKIMSWEMASGVNFPKKR